MSHLGPRVSALLDGELSPDAAARARAHAATCAACRLAVERERQVRTLLRAAPGPEASADLVDALLTMGGPCGPLPPRPGHLPGTPRPETLSLGRRPTRRAAASGPGRAVLRRSSQSSLTPPWQRVPSRAGARSAGTAPRRRSPGRRIRRGLVVAVAGGVSLAGASLLSVVVLSGLATDPATVAPASTRLSDDQRLRPPAVPASQVTPRSATGSVRPGSASTPTTSGARPVTKPATTPATTAP